MNTNYLVNRGSRISMAILALILTLATSSCLDGDSITPIDNETKEINGFVFDNMKQYYLWNNKITQTNANTDIDPFEFFDKLLYKSIDKWSFITDDYQGLVDYFKGVMLSNGMNFQLYRYENDTKNIVIGVVEYVNENGPADRAGIIRGDIFYQIDGVDITENNYQSLLSKDKYTLTFCKLTETQLETLSPTKTLVAEVLNVNPIQYKNTYEFNGNKIGYIVLTSFNYENENELIDLFSEFKSQNITDLVLDLRYNPGGTISTANLLASMIGPASIAGQTMIKNIYNKELTEYIETMPNKESLLTTQFLTPAHNLNLSRLYVLTTNNTASASEMVAYSLAPYMNVVQIGDVTHGKYFGSISIYDETGKHNWAIQPIIMKSANADNSIDYSSGLKPDYIIEDDYDHQLGDPNEELLSKALSLITGGTFKGERSSSAINFINQNSRIDDANDLFKPQPSMILDNKTFDGLFNN